MDGRAVTAGTDGPPPAFWALTAAATAEYERRVRRATLIPVLAGLLGVFALGSSVLPDALTSDLLLSYLVFLGVYGVVLALALLQVSSGPYGAAMSVAAVAHRGTQRAMREATDEDALPATPVDAVAWLERHRQREGIEPQRLTAQVLAGDLAGARESLRGYPADTAFQRYWREADAWFLDRLESGSPGLAAVEAEVMAVEDPALRAHAESGLATLRAYDAAAAGADWIAPLAAVQGRVGEFTDDSWRVQMVVRIWTWHMAIASLMVGLALLVARFTGAWGLG
jgi:hypothetical protein